MTRVLFLKELRALRPWALFALVLMGVTALDSLLTTPGPKPLGDTFSSIATMPLPLIYGLIALALGTGLAVKERDEGTLAFLDSLPVTRTRVFVVKFLTAWLVLVAFPGFQLGWVVLEHALSRGSLDEPFHWNILVGALVMQLQLMATFLAVGALAGFARSLTWLVVGLLAVSLQRLIHFVPRLSALNPLQLVESGVEGVRWRFDTEAVVVQAGLLAVSFSLAWLFFVRSGRSRTLVVNPRPVVGAFVGVATLGVLMAGAVLWWDGPSEGSSSEPDLEAIPESAPGSTTTEHYEFSYPSIQSGPALALAEQADSSFQQVAALLGAPDGGALVFVDLSGSMRNTVGTAFKDRIRMRADYEPVPTLAHETSHVLARRMVGEEGFARWSAARVLDEGLASWVEGHFLEHPAEEQLVLAALLDRNQLELADVIDFERFTREGDDDLKYAIGRGLIDAMVKRYGPSSIPKLLAAFGDGTLPPKLSGAGLWQAVFQLAGMDLGLVADDFFGVLELTAKERRAELDALPRPEATLVTSDDAYGVKATAAGELPGLALRFRPAPDSRLDEYDRTWVLNGDVAWRDLSSIQRRRLCFQVGVQLAPKATLFEPWSCLPLSSATPLPPPEPPDAGLGDEGP